MLHECVCEKPLKKYMEKDDHNNWKCPQRTAHGLLCRKHFEQHGRMEWEVAECSDCQNARKEDAERIQRTETIDPNQPYGQHISLMCKNHPDLRWSTKNIGYIGARSIFYSSQSVPECSCSSSLLTVVQVVPHGRE